MRCIALWALVALTSSASAQRVSTSARCGPAFGLTCQGSRWGNCCSQYLYCGTTESYCASGCQVGWGTCKNSPSLSSIIQPGTTSPTLKVTTNARCGTGFGFSCQGSRWGDCCSQHSYCGSTDAYCGKGCQQGYGKCNSVSSSASRSTQAFSSLSVSASTFSTSVVLSSVASSSVASSSVASSSVASFSAASSTILSFSVLLSSTASSPQSSTLSTTVTPSATPTPCNVFVNPGFEAGQAPWVTEAGSWTFAIKTCDGHNSNNYLAGVTTYTDNTGFSTVQTITIPQDVLVEATAYIRATSVSNPTGGRLFYKWYLNNASFGVGNNVVITAGTGWVKASSGQAMMPAGTHRFVLSITKNSGVQDMEVGVDDFSLVPVASGTNCAPDPEIS